MTCFVPFSARSKKWEPIAEDLRDLCPAQRSAKVFDPWPLAMELGLRVVNCKLQGLDDQERRYMEALDGARWSGGVLPDLLSDGSRVCMLNPMQSLQRQRITLMEEISHCFLDHTPTSLTLTGQIRYRDFDKKQEEEAFGVGAAVLMPWRHFFGSLNSGKTCEELAREYDVTPDLALYRIKISGAMALYRKRVRS